MSRHEDDWEHPEEAQLAREAGLTFRSDESPGYYRRRRGQGWSYHFPDGRLVEDETERKRVRTLAIPPAWTDVWISQDPSGHLQATGRDDQGRKQYRYHPGWEGVREGRKLRRLRAFGHALPDIRREVDRLLNQDGLSRERVLAACVTILDRTGIRLGNGEYARQNGTYGLATLRDRHTEVDGSTVVFEYKGKAGRRNRVELRDRRVAAVVRQCSETPGYEVFKWMDDTGRKHDVEAEDVNEFIREISSGGFTAKDFRTWVGNVQAFEHLCACSPPENEQDARANCLAALDAVAERLGNTREVAGASYVQSEMLEGYLRAGTGDHFRAETKGGSKPTGARSKWLSDAERSLVVLLEALPLEMG